MLRLLPSPLHLAARDLAAFSTGAPALSAPRSLHEPFKIAATPAAARAAGAGVPSWPLSPPPLLHLESRMLLRTKHIPHAAVHVTYTSDALAVNRWVRRCIYNEGGTVEAAPVAPSSAALGSAQHRPVLYVGLDVEWKANRAKGEDNQVAVVQLATRHHVLVFHSFLCRLPAYAPAWALESALAEHTETGEHRHAVPLELARVFSDPGLRFVGVGVKNDLVKSIRDLRLSRVPLHQLQLPPRSAGTVVSASLQPILFAPPATHSYAAERVVEMSERWLTERRIAEGHGLKALSVRVLSLHGWSARGGGGGGGGSDVSQHSQWEQPLTGVQIRYAALDAWASAVVHSVLEAHERRVPEREEMARRAAAGLLRRVLLRLLLYGTAKLRAVAAYASAAASPIVMLRDAAAAAVPAAALGHVDYLPSRPLHAAALVADFEQAELDLRDAFSLAMSNATVAAASEDVLSWFDKGALTNPPPGGTGHNRTRKPFPKPRRRLAGKPRVVPDARYVMDVRLVLCGGDDSAVGSPPSQQQLSMVPLARSDFLFASQAEPVANDALSQLQ